MCIFFLYCNQDPSPEKFTLILAFNREEVLDRPTVVACWQDGFLASRDQLSGGGTWLGINRRGKIAMLTNIYTGGVTHSRAKSRGKFINDFLSGKDSTKQYMEKVKREVENSKYNPFNLCLLEMGSDDIYKNSYMCHRLDGTNDGPRLINDEEILGISNHPRVRPFKKTRHGTRIFQRIVDKHNDIGQTSELLSDLKELMCDETRHFPDPQVSMLALESGSTVEKCRYKANYCYSTFVRDSGDNCGTMTQTFVLVDYERRVTFVERSRLGCNKCGLVEWKEKTYKFQISQ